jgi:hypothetical protein
MPLITFNARRKTWAQKKIEADQIWSQLKLILGDIELPKTPRRPDVRLIVNNIDPVARLFHNPAGHSSDMNQSVPDTGAKTAAMIMTQGKTLPEQFENARSLVADFALNEKGLSAAFVKALDKDCAGGRIKEAYGPAPYTDRIEELKDLHWRDAGGNLTQIIPFFGKAASYGARQATTETAFHTHVPIWFVGTDKTPELMESLGIVLTVSKDRQTGQDKTRQVMASVAQEFYGAHFANMPEVKIHPDGYITDIDLKDGRQFQLAQPRRRVASARPA